MNRRPKSTQRGIMAAKSPLLQPPVAGVRGFLLGAPSLNVSSRTPIVIPSRVAASRR